ncbi:MAG: PadR family transcriptional regulator [Pyrobaculum sp.]
MGPPPWAFLGRRGLREIVLGMLADKPLNGAEVIRAVEDLTWGFWRPSPGSIYPLLRQLEAEGLVKKRADGRYELTDVGRRAASPWPRWPFRWGPPRTVEEVIDELENWALYLLDLAASEPGRLAPHRDRSRQIGDMLHKI